jgi:hypothetical protein
VGGRESAVHHPHQKVGQPDVTEIRIWGEHERRGEARVKCKTLRANPGARPHRVAVNGASR